MKTSRLLLALVAASALTLTVTPAQAGKKHHNHERYSYNDRGWQKQYRNDRVVYYGDAPTYYYRNSRPVVVERHRPFFWPF